MCLKGLIHNDDMDLFENTQPRALTLVEKGD